MIETIWKYILDMENSQVFDIPEGGEILSAQMQGKYLCMWVRVDPDMIKEPRTIRIFGTGHEMGCFSGRFIDTFQMDGGSFIFHVFEEEVSKK